MNKSAWTITKLNLKNIKFPYMVTGILFFAMLVQDSIKVFLTLNGSDIGDQVTISIGHCLWLLIPLAAIFVAAKNFRKTVNLGGKRNHFFAGSFIAYLILAAAVSLAVTIIFYSYDKIIMNTGTFNGIVNLLDIWGWAAHGPVIAFIQQFAFLFLLATFTHTLTTLQGSLCGWIANVLLAAIIAVFTPIAPLRAYLYSFFRMILFHPNAVLQIVTCIVLAVGLCALSYPILNKKKI